MTTTKKREKLLFDVEDLVNVVICALTKDDAGFIHECMRVQMTFLILVYRFSGARIGAFLHNGKDDPEKVTSCGRQKKLHLVRPLWWGWNNELNQLEALNLGYWGVGRSFLWRC